MAKTNQGLIGRGFSELFGTVKVTVQHCARKTGATHIELRLTFPPQFETMLTSLETILKFVKTYNCYLIDFK